MFTNGKYESAESLQTKHRFLHWLHVMISKRPGTVESPGGIHRRRHQKRRKAVKLLPKCCPKQKSPSFRGGIFRKAELLFALFRYTVERLKKSEGIFSLLELYGGQLSSVRIGYFLFFPMLVFPVFPRFSLASGCSCYFGVTSVLLSGSTKPSSTR